MSTKITGAVIVAAGMSSRMHSFKPMLPLAGATVIRTLIGTLQKASVAPIIVVTGRNGQELTEHILDMGVETVMNEDYSHTDMFYSACLGLKAIHNRADRVFFLPGDVPLFSHYSVTAMNEYMDQYPCEILIPAYNGRQGHPVLFSNSLIGELIAYRGEGGLKGAIDSSTAKKVIIALPDQGLVMDADNPEDYRRLEQYSASTAQLPALSCATKISLCRTENFFDEQLARVLELTDKYGSLARACKQAGVSYSYGWQGIRRAEEQLGFILLQSSRGGEGGGGSHLTNRGAKFLEAYRKFRRSVERYSRKQLEKHFTDY